MQTLIIYDATGRIYYQASGDVQEPTGIPFLWVEVPEGKYITGVDVSGDTPSAILEDLPVSSVTLLQEQVTTLQETLDALVLSSLEEE
jgi:hypothetical protein